VQQAQRLAEPLGLRAEDGVRGLQRHVGAESRAWRRSPAPRRRSRHACQCTAGKDGAREAEMIYPRDRVAGSPTASLAENRSRIPVSLRLSLQLGLLVYLVWFIQRTNETRGMEFHRAQTKCRPRAFVAANHLVWAGAVAGLAPERDGTGLSLSVGTLPWSAENLMAAAAVPVIKARRTSNIPALQRRAERLRLARRDGRSAARGPRRRLDRVRGLDGPSRCGAYRRSG
jgi:hypothetical protein